MRKIAVITGSRAEYGLLYWILRGIHDTPELELQLLVTGMHLSPEFDLTVREIEAAGFPIADRVEMLLSSDTEEAVAVSMGLGTIGFAKSYQRLQPDMLLVLGDRFEIFAAVASAVPFRIPVAHIHGGESTEGAMDELFRHAMTKMSHLHFPATRAYADRIVQMGEPPERVFCFGAPGLDNVYQLDLLTRNALVECLKVPQDRPFGVVTYHPVTLEENSVVSHMEELLPALKNFPEIYWIFTLPNADTGGRIIIRKIEDFVNEYPDAGKDFPSLGQLRYLSLLKHAVAMVGNSSSGLTEAPSFALPVVNIGERQQGRIRARNVLDVPICNKDSITETIRTAISEEFRNTLQGIKNPYGEGAASEKIVETVKTFPLNEGLLKKHFYDILNAH
ncbi:MAG: UDP-N-acetylglucosamine 2-epimerase (hydrolyzing) [bacterium]|nr:UDP-N-acetylglucosamine 2-epimerase (hydrolyzing) [bacterium]